MHELLRSALLTASAASLPVVGASRGLAADNGEQRQAIHRAATAALEGKRECVQQQLDLVMPVLQYNSGWRPAEVRNRESTACATQGKLNIRLATTWIF